MKIVIELDVPEVPDDVKQEAMDAAKHAAGIARSEVWSAVEWWMGEPVADQVTVKTEVR